MLLQEKNIYKKYTGRRVSVSWNQLFIHKKKTSCRQIKYGHQILLIYQDCSNHSQSSMVEMLQKWRKSLVITFKIIITDAACWEKLSERTVNRFVQNKLWTWEESVSSGFLVYWHKNANEDKLLSTISQKVSATKQVITKR